MSIQDLQNQDSWAPSEGVEQGPAVEQKYACSAKQNSLLQGNLVLGFLFTVAIGGIFMLHFSAGPQQASAAIQANESKMDSFLKTLVDVKNSCNDPASNAASLVNPFYFEARQRQVPAEQLQVNPFRLILPEADGPPSSPLPTITPQANSAGPAVGDMNEKLNALSLQSVMTGSAGATAMISNNLLTVGQTISGWTVADIQPRQVTLRWGDQTHVLKMK